ncbi:putative ATP-dependent RNA helicase TDRD12 isoform X2 [Mixophyes fleayi]|uniref:putative ATP-dependent RNA helicase TDRD12 isoform X2 n=1 Tax=Mixophyes fleayi TaxID=3061075 RepID=UPI003F4D7BC2
MYELSVLQVTDPSCFFCEILKVNDSKEYDQLFQELNLLYGKMYRDVEELKPASLPIGTFCVVFCEELKSWCRATLESNTCSAQDELVECFLLDHALYSPIKKSNIRFPVEECQRIPFRARKFKLHQVQPISLHFSVREDKADFRSTKNWDTAAIHYFQHLLNESTKVEAQLCSVENDCMSVYLYLTTTDNVLCVNDDLVAKKFACYPKEGSPEKIENVQAVFTLIKELQPTGLLNGHAWPPLCKEQPESLESQKSRAAATHGELLWPFWSSLSHAQRLATEAVEKSAVEIRSDREEAAVPHDKEEAQYSGCEIGNPLLPVGKGVPQSFVCDIENNLLPLGKELQSSNSHDAKVVTSPDSLLSFTDRGPWLATELPKNTSDEIRGGIEDTSDPLVTEEPLSSEMEDKVEAGSGAAQFLWPAWCNIDHKRRLSTEIMEKSVAKISTLSDGEPTLSQEHQDKQDCAKLLQFLNPNPVHVLEDIEKSNRKPQYPLFASKFLIPYSTLESALLHMDIKKRLMTTGYDGPNLAESYCWAPIAQGFDTIVISPSEINPMCYIPPLLTFLNCASVVYKLLPSKHGPYAVIICPGWDKAHTVYKLLMDYSKCIRPINPILLLVGLKKEEIESINFRKQCEVIVATPQSLLRCVEHHGLLLLRLCHLVLDEVEVLFSKAGPEMSVILDTYKKIVSAENRDEAPQQIVAIGSTWHRDIELLLEYTSSPQIIITRVEQAAVFANVQQVIHVCLDCEKLSVLLQCLDFTPVNAEKILIFTKSDEEAELVHKAVKTSSTYSLLLHRNLVHNFSHVLEQWNKIYGHGTVVALVVTDDYAPILEITDATWIIHYGFPENVDVLSQRLFSLLNYIQSKIDKVTMGEQDHLRAKSVLLMTEKHARHAVGVLNCLQQTQATIPPELVNLTQGILQAREDMKSDQDLCPYLKTFGYCTQDKYSCPGRHQINPILDLRSGISPIPETNQYLIVLPLCIVDATRFFGRIITKNYPYDQLVVQLNEHYQSPVNKVPKQTVECKQLYAIKGDSVYHRVQVLGTKTTDSILYAHIQYIDHGKMDEVPGHLLLPLPSAFHTLPPQRTEFIVCRVKPIDNEDKWDPKVTRIISRNIKGKHHRAKVVLILGNTYWLDPMVQVSILSSLSTCVYELNVRHEILFTGLGTDNPQHLLQLQALLEPSGASSAIRAPDEQLPSLDGTTNEHSVSTPLRLEGVDSDKQVDLPDDAESQTNLPVTSLHPEVKWWERDNVVILTVKLQEITDHKCTFYRDRVVFSCIAGGKQYTADLSLYKDIMGEKSECSIKNGEAVITIRKSKSETWNKLLKNKHPNVSFDFDHLEDSEDNNWFTAELLLIVTQTMKE